MLNRPHVRDKVIQLIGLIAILVGSLTICGHISGKLGLYIWDISMPLSGAIGFVGMGIAIFLIGRRLHHLK